MPRITRANIVSEVSDHTGFCKKDVDRIIEVYEETVKKSLQHGNEVYLHGFGTFEVRERDARDGRNPFTGEAIAIPKKRHPKFVPAKPLRDAVAQFETSAT